MEQCSADGLPWIVVEEERRAGPGSTPIGARSRPPRRVCLGCRGFGIPLGRCARPPHFGTALYGALLALLKRQGYLNCYALITEGNFASEEFHKALGFEPAARLERCGYKMGQWLSLCCYHLALAARPQAPARPVPLSAVPAEQAASVLRRAAMLVKGAGGH